MSSNKEKEDKLKKKLKNFFDKNTSLSRRWKSLMSYVERATNEELNKFFNENFYMIYGVFLDTFSAYENSCKKGKHSNSELQDLLTVLKNVLIHLAELIRRKWQIKSISSILEKVMCRENKIGIRLLGFERLLVFLEAVGVPERAQIQLFAQAIDLTVFQPNYPNVTLRNSPLTAQKQGILVPASSTPTIEQNVQLFEQLLDYMSNKPSNFEFWWDLLKQQYFPEFYPEICKQLKLLDASENTGFKPLCPHQIQSALINRLDKWLKNEAITHILWSSEENVQLMLEVYKQSCNMSVEHDDTIKMGISVYKTLFWTKKPHADIAPKLVEYRKFFLEQLKGIFTKTETPKEMAQKHIALCKEVVSLFTEIFLDMYESMDPDTQQALMYTVLDTTTTMLDGTGNEILVDALSSTMLDIVLFIWIRTKTKRTELWKALQDGIFGIFHCMEPVTQTKIKLLQLTWIIREMMYPIKQKKKKPPRPNAEGHEKVVKEQALSISPDTKPAPRRPAKDPKITDLQWDTESLVYVWHQVLHIFDNVNNVRDPMIHAACMTVLQELITILVMAEHAIPFENTKDDSKPKPLLLIEIFGPWLFEACSLGVSFLRGKAIAIDALCNLVCRHHHGTKLPIELYSHFYATIIACLKEHPNSPVSHAIISSSNNIFNLGLPGANILIPVYLNEIKQILKPGSKASTEVRTKSILIVGSLICYPNHLASLSLPQDPLNLEAGTTSFNSLKTELISLITDTLTSAPIAEHKVMCLWLLCNLIFEEIFHCKTKQIIQDIMKTINPFCLHSDWKVVRAALDCLSTLTQEFHLLLSIDADLPSQVIKLLCGNIVKQIKQGSFKEDVVAAHYYCLLDWIMACATNQYLFKNKDLANKTFDAIEIGLLGQKLQPGQTMAKRIPVKPEKEKEIPAKERLKDKKAKRISTRDPYKEAQPTKSIEVQVDMLEVLRDDPSHKSPVVKEAAGILLIQLCNFLCNFPSRAGIEIMSSLVIETDDTIDESQALFYIYNDFALFSLVEVAKDNGDKVARIIMRDSTGKYAWDALMQYDPPPPSEIEPCSLLKGALEPQKIVEVVRPEAFPREVGSVPAAFEETDEQGGDQIEQLLLFLSEFDDCTPISGRELNTPATPRSEDVKLLQHSEEVILAQFDADNAIIQHASENRKPIEHWNVDLPQTPQPQSIHHYCRLFLSQLGYLSFFNKSSFQPVENTQRFQRSVIQLDKTSGREMLKIGVIYVKEGQDDQKIIFRNDTKSALYAEFVRGIGWPVDIATHKGYLGGLDPHLTTGTSAPYYANSIMEVIFHEITSMPTVKTDPQQIHKKRHVGNDIVHIIYSEHVNDYDPTTITSQFNDAHIIIYPLPNGLFRIQVYRKDKVPLFGPLLHGMCVNKKLLPILVRQTAINANRYVRYNTGGYSRPFPTRRRALNEIVDRFKVEQPYERLISELIKKQKT